MSFSHIYSFIIPTHWVCSIMYVLKHCNVSVEQWPSS